MSDLDRWAEMVARELSLADLDPADRDRVLDLARVVAHGVVRPAAPVSAYLVGIAVGQGADPAATVARLTGLAGSWTPSDAGADHPQ
jgi:hypothetical protein